MTTDPADRPGGMTRRQARRVEYSIIGLCIVSLALIFQPFSLTLFSIGAGLVVVAGLAFNLVPHCRPGVPARALGKVALIILLILVSVIAFAIGSAELYAIYLRG